MLKVVMMKIFNLRFIAALFTTLLFLHVPSVASAGGRYALVIGNSAYGTVGRLNNPVNDATSMSQALERLHFDVTLVKDASKATFETALADFSEKTGGADIALIYYAGHAMEMNGENYLIPVDATLKTDSRVTFETVTLNDMLKAVDGAPGLKMVLLDSCRNNPFLETMVRRKEGRAIGRGLAINETPLRGLLIGYSAAAGTTADDGAGDHSPYTAALLDNIEKPGLELNMLFRTVSAAVKKKTNNEQTPFEYGSLPDEAIYLVPPVAAAPVIATPAVDKPAEVASLPKDTSGDAGSCINAGTHWNAIQNSNDTSVFEEHIRLFPNCGFASLARHRVEEMEKAGQVAPETECDRLAAQPTDGQKLESVHGVAFDDIRLPAATQACQSAVAQYPSEARLVFQLARTYDKAKDLETAMAWYQKAALLGSLNAMSNIGWIYQHDTPPNYEEARRWYQKAIDAGSSNAMINMGFLFENGQGVEKDPARAVDFFRMAADLGNSEAMNDLGSMLRDGLGVSKDVPEAMVWFRKAADLGNAPAMNNLGFLLRNGVEVTSDPVEAMAWFTKSADLHNSVAMVSLADMFQRADGVPHDRLKAFLLLNAAAQADSDAGLFNLAIMFESGHLPTQENFQTYDSVNLIASEQIPRDMTLPLQDSEKAAGLVYRAIKRGNENALLQMKTNNNLWSLRFKVALQNNLKSGGFYSGPSDGKFGKSSYAAMQAAFGKSSS